GGWCYMSDYISKQALKDWINTRKTALSDVVGKHTGYHKRHLSGQHSSLVDLEWEINEGKFDLSDQGEVARLREALEQVANEPTTKFRFGDSTYWLTNARKIARKALSIHTGDTEPVGAQRVRAMYKAWSELEEESIFSPETIANIIADVAGAVG